MIEIRSPNDESYEKLPFFAKLGVREVVIIDRSKKHPEVYRLAGSQYLAVAPDSDGWVLCEVLGIRLRAEGEQTAVLAIVDAADPAIRVAI